MVDKNFNQDITIERRKYQRMVVDEPLRLYHDSMTFEESFGDISLS